jgi:hypothetical protein
MSGLGKTRLASLMRDQGEWFHYSIDYRIGTAYMGEHITDNLKREAMKVPFLADLLRSDSIYIGSNITFGNLAPLSTFLGKPGDTARGRPALRGIHAPAGPAPPGRDQRASGHAQLHLRARDIYGYPNVVCDTGGSICEVVDPDDPEDPVLRTFRPIRCWSGSKARRRIPKSWSVASMPRPNRCITSPDFLHAAVAGVPRHTASRPTRSTPTPSCASPMPARWPIARRSMPRWRGTGASASPPPRSKAVRDAADVTAWWPPPLADTARRLGRRPRAEEKPSPPCPSACPPPCPPSTCCATRASWSWAGDAADRQDIRPLRIGLLNLMPKKIQTETQFARLIGATPLQVELSLIRMTSHETKNTAAEHMEAFYRPFARWRRRARNSTV